MVDYLLIGTVLKPQGVRGECKIKSYAARPELFAGWTALYLSENGAYTPLSCEVRRIQDGFVYAVLGACRTADDAERYRNRDLFIDRAHAAPPEEGGEYIADLIGCEAVDENGITVGCLTDVLQYGPVDTWVFRTAQGTLMVPALLSVFPSVDVKNRRIAVVSDRLREVAVLDD